MTAALDDDRPGAAATASPEAGTAPPRATDDAGPGKAVTGNAGPGEAVTDDAAPGEAVTKDAAIDAIDRRIILATQAGLPLTPRPYHAVAAQTGLAPEEVMARLARMLESGALRRIAAVPNHYALGFRSNGMTVWDVADAEVAAAGARIGALAFVSHCYQRPRHLPDWPYNLFAMVHGRRRQEVEEKVRIIAALLGPHCRGYDVLYSTRILKKTGLRLGRG